MPMGLTAENVAKQYNISREVQDKFAASSQNKAEQAQAKGLFDEEIVPITTRYVDKETKEQTTITLDRDEGVRKGVSSESLAKLKPAFIEKGTGTAGNSSQVSDGAAAITLTRRDIAERLGIKPLGRFVGTSVKGCPPSIMG